MTEKIKNSNQEKTLFDTEQQSRKERVFAAAGDYLFRPKEGRRPLQICRSKDGSDRIG